MKFKNYNCDFYIRVDEVGSMYLLMEKGEEKMPIPLIDISNKHLLEIMNVSGIKTFTNICEKISDEKKRRNI